MKTKAALVLPFLLLVSKLVFPTVLCVLGSKTRDGTSSFGPSVLLSSAGTPPTSQGGGAGGPWSATRKGGDVPRVQVPTVIKNQEHVHLDVSFVPHQEMFARVPSCTNSAGFIQIVNTVRFLTTL